MTNSINVWLDHLRVLCPPTGVMLVGAGAGTSNWVQRLAQWEAPNVTLVEADEAQFQHLQRTTPRRGDWHLHKHVISSATESVNFHQASNSAESGLVEPEALQSLWPNIKTRKTQARQAITLADLQQDAETPANWLMVDCLPALAIIQSGADQLSAFDLIAVRVLLDDGTLPHGMASLGEVQTFLEALGFQCLASEAGRHPAFGHALFLRDSQAVTRQLHQKLGQHAEVHLAQAQQLTEAHAAKLALTTQTQQLKDELEHTKTETAATALNLAEERSVLAQQLSQAEAVAEKLIKELQLQIEELQQTHDQTVQLFITETEQLKGSVQTDSAAWAQVKAELTQTRDNASKLAAERQIQIEQLKQVAEQATAKVNASAAASEAAATQAEERAAQIQQLSQAKAAADKLAADRQQQLEELKRTQAQAVQAQLDQITATAQGNSATWASEKLELTQALEKADKLTKESQLQIEQHKQAAEQEKFKVNAAETSAAATAKLVDERAAQVQQLSQAKAAAEKLASDYKIQIEQLRQAVEQATAKVSAAEAAVSSNTTLTEERVALVEQLTQTKSVTEKLAAEHRQLTVSIQKLEQTASLVSAELLEEKTAREKAETALTERSQEYDTIKNQRDSYSLIAKERLKFLMELQPSIKSDTKNGPRQTTRK